ncbi:hypothetical protein LLG46_02780 [bacterium]|nr:hypothetical protein [bacterium]
MKSQYRMWHLVVIIALIAALCATSMVAMANGKVKLKPMPKEKPAPAMTGRGPTTVTLTTVTASSIGNCAWMYTSLPLNQCPPTSVAGTIQAMATKGPAGAAVMNDRASVLSTFTCPAGGPTYTVKFVSLASAGRFNTPFGGIAFERSIFGDTKFFAFDLPSTTAFVALVGIATIMKDNDVIADNQPALAAITHGIHDANHCLLSQADITRKEFHLIVPGSLVDGVSPVPNFPNGYFYIYWPSADFNISKETITIPAETIAPLGRGPSNPGKLVINLTDKGIHKTVGTAQFGLYDITVKNISKKPQGLYMTGTDICCTDYKRFSTILKPGASQKFTFYFAPGKVVMRPFCCAIKTPTSYKDYNWTGPATSIKFE